jgi:hypothetical protein
VSASLASASAAIGCIALALVLGAHTAQSSQAKGEPQTAINHEDRAVEIQMRNVDFRLAPDIDLEVRTLRGRLRKTKPDHPVTFDDSDSFVVEIDTGEVAITAASLSALLNSYVFAYPGAPIKNIQVSIKGSRLSQKGTLHKGVDLPFEIEGPVSSTPDGDIRLHAEKIKSAHIPFKGLLHLFGADLSKLVNENAGRGAKIEGDDIILSPRGITPPPHLEGHVAQVNVKDGRIIQVFDAGRHPPPLRPPFKTEAYIYHRGGVLRFGKLIMEDADLEIVGDQTKGFFHFFLREYKKQLIAGYSKNTPADGLIVHMTDYARLAARHSSHPAVEGREKR